MCSPQDFYSLYICPPTDDPSTLIDINPLTWLDVFAGETKLRQTSLTTDLLIGESFAFLGLTVLRQLLNYLDLPAPPPIKREVSELPPTQRAGHLALSWAYTFTHVYARAYAWVFTMQLLCTCAFLGIFGSWFLLATALDPTAFLPFGVAAVTLVTVATSMSAQLLASAAAVKAAMNRAFELMLKDRVTQAATKMMSLRNRSSQPVDVVSNALGSLVPDAASATPSRSSLGDSGLGEVSEYPRVEADAVDGTSNRTTAVTPEEIFALVNTDDDDVLDRDEFNKMFALLDLDLNESQREQLFALCDVDCTGTITEEEFVQGWDLMVETFLDEGAERVGLGKTRIIGIVLYILGSLGLVIAFVLVTLAAWANDDSFGAVVQSLLIGGAGRTSTSARSKTEAEDPEKLDDVVGSVLAEQKSNDAEG